MHSLSLRRYHTTEDGTLGLLSTNTGEALAYIIEDTYRSKKIKHETRISSGTYSLKKRNYGGFYTRYRTRFSDLNHSWMWELADVPNFTDILIHCGNSPKDSSGCLLVGMYPNRKDLSGVMVSSSADAYRRIYPIINQLYKENGDKLKLIITDR